MDKEVKNFLWSPKCQISNLFVVMTVINLIMILLLPSSFTYVSDPAKGQVKTVQIDAKTKVILFFGYLLGSLLMNYLIIQACKKDQDVLAILLYFVAYLVIGLVMYLLLFISGEDKQWR